MDASDGALFKAKYLHNPLAMAWGRPRAFRANDDEDRRECQMIRDAIYSFSAAPVVDGSIRCCSLGLLFEAVQMAIGSQVNRLSRDGG